MTNTNRDKLNYVILLRLFFLAFGVAFVVIENKIAKKYKSC